MNLNSQILNSALADDFLKGLREQALLENRAIFLSEAVSSQTAQKIISNLLVLDHQCSDPITIFQNSPGGEVNSGFAIYDTIRFIKSPVTIVNTGLCASIATIINIAVPKERRLSMPHARFLIHQPLIRGNIEGTASDIEIEATEILKTRATICKLLSEACGQPLARIQEDSERDYWMSAEEARDYGLISKIISKRSEL